jgi:hypothetical protein
MKLLIMQSSPASRHFLPPRPKYSRYPVVRHFSLCSSLSVRDQDSRPYKTTGKITVRPNPRPCVTFRNELFLLQWGVVSPSPNSKAGEPPLVGSPRLFIQYIRSYPSISGGRLLQNAPWRDDTDPHNTGTSRANLILCSHPIY